MRKKGDRPDQRVFGLAQYAQGWLRFAWPVIRYFDRISISLSQLLNTFCGGEPHETLSSRTYRYLETREVGDDGLFVDGWKVLPALLLATFLELFEHEHCRKAYERAHYRSRHVRVPTVD